MSIRDTLSTITFNAEQAKGAVRWVVGTFGAFIAGWIAATNFVTVDQVMSIFNSELFLALAANLIMWVWSFVSRSDKNLVIAATRVEAVTEVKVADKSLAEAVKESPAVEAKITASAK